MPLDLKKLMKLGKKALETAEELQTSAPVPESGAPQAGGPEPGPVEAQEAIVLYWKEAGEDTGWYCTRYEVDGEVLIEEGRVGEETENSPAAVEVAKQLFREHFGFDLAWEQPDPGELRFVGRRPG